MRIHDFSILKCESSAVPLFTILWNAHAAASDDVADLAQYNINKVPEIADKITSICQEPIFFEKILQKLFADCGLTMNFEQYALVDRHCGLTVQQASPRKSSVI